MKLSELRKYRRKVRQLALVEQQLRGYAATDPVQGSKGPPSFEKTTRYVEGYPHTERVYQLLSQRRWLKDQLQAIEDYIFSVEDERVCDALILYCMDERLGMRPTWDDVAREMKSPSGAAVKMAVYRFMHIT